MLFYAPISLQKVTTIKAWRINNFTIVAKYEKVSCTCISKVVSIQTWICFLWNKKDQIISLDPPVKYQLYNYMYVMIKFLKNYRSDTNYKIKHSLSLSHNIYFLHLTCFQSYTLPILYPCNLTLFQSKLINFSLIFSLFTFIFQTNLNLLNLILKNEKKWINESTDIKIIIWFNELFHMWNLNYCEVLVYNVLWLYDFML